MLEYGTMHSQSREAEGQRKTVIIVGGGIAGLSAAWHLHSRFPHLRFSVHEESDHWGGVLSTISQPPYLLETSADSFVVSAQVPEAKELALELGLESQLIALNPTRRRALIVRQGILHPVPEGFYLMAPRSLLPIFRSRLLSWSGKIRLACERFVPPLPEDCDESLEQFARRRVGDETYRWIVQPLIAGIYSADPVRLSVAAALPQLVQLERRYGSITRALQKSPELEGANSAGARYDKFMSFRDGMRTLPSALANQLPPESLHSRSRLEAIDRSVDGGWTCRFSTGESVHGHGLILAIPAQNASKFLQAMDQETADILSGISASSVAVANFAFKQSAMPVELDAFGVVVPHAEGRSIVAISLTSHKLPGRCPADEVLARVFLGGALHEEKMAWDDGRLLEIAWKELSEVLHVRGQAVLSHLTRWPRSTPQYHVGHRTRMDQLAVRLPFLPGLAVAGNSYQGIGIPQCIRSGRAAADRVGNFLGPSVVVRSANRSS